MKAWVLGMVVAGLSGCSSVSRPPDNSVKGAILRDLGNATGSAPAAGPVATPVQDSVINTLLPPLAPGLGKGLAQPVQPRFDLAVVDAPVEQVFAALVADTRYGMMVAPKPPAGQAGGPLVERMTLDLKNVTVQEALDAIRETYGFEYRIDGTRIFISYPSITTRLYHVNYILGQRRGVSDIQVVGGPAPSAGGAGGFASTQASGLSTAFKNDVWGDTEDSLRTLLGCNIGKVSTGAGGGAGAAAGAASGGGAAGGQARGGSARADVSFSGEPQITERQRGKDGCTDGRALSINTMSGTILVRAMPRELRMVESLLRSMQMVIDRQVIIEAKIIDVTLSSQSQQGINWSAFNRAGGHRASMGATVNEIGNAAAGGGTLSPNSTLGTLLGTGLTGTSGAFAAGMGLALQLDNFSALVNFLQTQGQVHVLSSPRISTLNNQKAVLKVGAEEPFVTNITGGSSYQTTAGPVSNAATMTYQPFFSGIALDVTPQISEGDDVILHVHALINNVTEKPKVSGPESKTFVPFAVNSINQADSVVRVRNGRVVVIGGLMTEKANDQRSRVPGAGDVPGAGLLFRNENQATTKRELVILLKVTVVKDEQAWAEEIRNASDRITELSLPATPQQP
ncbi:MAG: pilus (MSHA type) biogenesis protein MshL [Limnohabitans sp.]